MLTMNCPVCKASILQRVTLEQGPPAAACPQCGGLWLDSNEYLAWLRTRGAILPEKSPDEAADLVWDTHELKLCPSCRRILTRYRVLPDVQLCLDHCNTCNGVWFDRDEWDVLTARNLHDKVNRFFTEPWQARIKEAGSRQMWERLYLEKFGAEDYERLQATWEWLRWHPRRGMLLAFLQSDEPYRA